MRNDCQATADSEKLFSSGLRDQQLVVFAHFPVVFLGKGMNAGSKPAPMRQLPFFLQRHPHKLPDQRCNFGVLPYIRRLAAIGFRNGDLTNFDRATDSTERETNCCAGFVKSRDYSVYLLPFVKQLCY